MSKDTRHICDVLREEFLEPNNLSRIKAVKAMQMSNTVYSHTAKGKQMPSITFFSKLAHYTNTDVEFWIEQHARWCVERAKDLLAELKPRPCFEDKVLTCEEPEPYTDKDLIMFDLNALVRDNKKVAYNKKAEGKFSAFPAPPTMLK